jgi:hypothetical protein
MNLTTKLASALLALGHIPYEDSKRMTAAQIISLYQWDHYPVRKADGGSDAPWNIRPMLRAAHRAKTARVDMPAMAKSRRIQLGEAEHQLRMAAKLLGLPRRTGGKRRSSWPQRRRPQP